MAMHVALPYAIFGCVWILFSGAALDWLIGDPEVRKQIELAKGWFFVGVTAVLVYWLVRGYAVGVCESQLALRKSETRHRSIVDTALEGIATVDSDGRLTQVNAQMARLLGGTSEGLLGRELAGLLDDDAAAEIGRMLRLRGPGRSGALRLRTLDGQERWAIAAVSPLENGSPGRGESLVMLTDLTADRKLEEQLRQSQKMEAVGRLAGGVAHDFNTLLTAMLGHLELARRRIEHEGWPDGVNADLEQIERAGQRAAALTRQLLAFSRRQLIKPELITLNRLLPDMEKMLRRLIREDVDLRVVPGEGLWPVRADSGQVEQVIMNLVLNASDAMPQGGRIAIETANLMLDASYVASHPGASPGRHILLGVSDTGTGMDSEVQEHIFEPFFTTKPAGKGTGLGLATVYGIVQQLGGHITVESRLGQGSTFRVYLPALIEEGAASNGPAQAARPPQDLARPGETLLVCEDDDPVRSLMARVLESAGYTVLSAAQPGAALEIAAAYAGRIALLLTDVIMPGMNGRQLAERLGGLRPGLRVLYVSGHSESVLDAQGVVEANVMLLTKPFSAEQLLHRVREALDAAHVGLAR